MNRNPRNSPYDKYCMVGFFSATLILPSCNLGHLKNYLKVVSNFLGSELGAFRQNTVAELRVKGLVGEAADAFYEMKSEDLFELETIFPSTICNTVLIAACSLFEAGLMEVCKELDSEQNIATSTSWDQTDETGVRRAAKFIRKNFAVHTEDHPLWNNVLDYYTIRDCIIHAQGNVELMKDGKRIETQNAISRLASKGVKIGKHSRIEVDIHFLESMIEEMISFWEALETAFAENQIVGPIFWPARNP